MSVLRPPRARLGPRHSAAHRTTDRHQGPGPRHGLRRADHRDAARRLGADVIKVEHPKGDPARTHGLNRDGHGLWWKVIARNKRAITLNFGKPEGADLLRKLVADADVLVENFRPGVMEKWGLGPDELLEINPRLVMLRVTGFGQTGPYSQRRAFGTLMEAMSGFAHQTGQEDGPPTLPPFGLADGVAGITGAFAVMAALYKRDEPGRATGRGQVIDLRCSNPCSASSGPGPTRLRPARHHLRAARQPVAEQRPAQRLPHPRRPLGGHLGQRHVDRGAGHAPGRARRPGREAVVLLGRGARPARGDARPRGRRSGSPPVTSTRSQGLRGGRRGDRAGLRHRTTRQRPACHGPRNHHHIADEDLGDLKMQNLIFRMGDTPGAIRWAGRRLGQDTEQVLRRARRRRRRTRGAAGEGGALMDRSYLFAPGHNAKLLDKVFAAGADAVMLDLEDAVPPEAKDTARRMVAEVLVDATRRPGLGPGERRAHRLVRGRPRRGRRTRARDPDPQDRVRRRRAWVAGARPRVSRSSARSRAPAGCSRRRRSPRRPGCRYLAMGGVDLQHGPQHHRREPQTLYVRQLPRHRVPGRRDRTADRQRLPAPGRRDRTARAGGVRQVAGVLRQVGDPPAAAARTAQGVHAHRAGDRLGSRGRRGVRRRRRCEAYGCPAGSSSTFPWRGGPSACWTPLRRGPRRRRREDAEMTTDTSAAAGVEPPENQRRRHFLMTGEGWPYLLVPLIPVAVVLEFTHAARRGCSWPRRWG